MLTARHDMMTQLTVVACRPATNQPAIRHTLLTRSDVVSRGAVATLPALDTRWFDAGNSPAILVVALAIIAVIALMVAAVAYSSDPRRRPRRSAEDDSELVTMTPLPMPKEELARLQREPPPHHAFAPLGLPRWVQLGSVVIALGITYIAAQRVRTDRAAVAHDQVAIGASRGSLDADADDGSPESLDLAATPVPPFSFRARDFVSANGGCTGHLEVAKGAPAAWSLTARVHDDRGQLIDTAFARVGDLREGDVVEFRFRRASCERIGAWDVRGARLDP